MPLKPETLLCPRPEGLYCPPGDFFVDPVRPLAPATSTRREDFAGVVVIAPPSAIADRWSRRFVEPLSAGRDFGLVLEAAFEGLQRSPRHKSGVAMRFPRISRIRWDKPAREADELDSLTRMLEAMEAGGECNLLPLRGRRRGPSEAWEDEGNGAEFLRAAPRRRPLILPRPSGRGPLLPPQGGKVYRAILDSRGSNVSVTIFSFSAAVPPALSPVALARARLGEALSGDPQVWRNLLESFGGFAVNLVIAGLILGATFWAAGFAAKLVRRAIERLPSRNPADTTLQSFAGSLTRWGVIVVGLIAVLQQLGVQTTSILAVLGAASLAIGLALQGALSNVAAGVMILILRPYRVGDAVEINGRSGTVKALDLFGTQLSDADNLDIFVPNSKVFGEVIINYSTPVRRRMELNFRVDYADDLDRALAALLAAAGADERILREPAPDAKVTALGESAVTVTLHAWAPVKDYWDARFALIKRAKEALDAAGLAVAYPHQVSVERVGKHPTSAHPGERRDPDERSPSTE